MNNYSFVEVYRLVLPRSRLPHSLKNINIVHQMIPISRIKRYSFLKVSSEKINVFLIPICIVYRNDIFPTLIMCYSTSHY